MTQKLDKSPAVASATASAVVIALCLASPTALARDDSTVERKIAAAPNSTIQVSNVSGSVEVRGTSASEVFVRGRLGRDVERLDVINEDGKIRVVVVLPRKRNLRDGSADLEIRIPHSATLEVSTTSADVTTEAVIGRQDLATVSGEITAEIGSAEIDAKSVSGDVDLRGIGKPADVTVSTVSGNVSLDRASGEFEGVTVSGDVEVELGDTSDVRVRTTSGNAIVRGKLLRGARVNLETVSGDFDLTFASVAGFQTEIESFSGTIGGCMKSSVKRASKYGPGTRLETTLGGGSARIRAKSLSGDIDICDR
jgi:DUF4097 and DUF4098 domain-containing protein YvlB